MVNCSEDILPLMDSYRVNDRAWELIIKELRKRRENGETLEAIGKHLAAHKSTVKLWLDNQRGGERTSFRDMIRYLDRLNIPFDQVFGAGIYIPEKPHRLKPSTYEENIAKTLAGAATVFGKNARSIASEVGEGITTETVQKILDGEISMTVKELTAVCSAIDILPETVMKRARELTLQPQEKKRKTRRSA